MSQIEGWPKWDLSNSNFPPFCLFWIAVSQCKHWKICCWPIRICFDLKSGGKFKRDKWFLCHPSIWLNLSALVKNLNLDINLPNFALNPKWNSHFSNWLSNLYQWLSNTKIFWCRLIHLAWCIWKSNSKILISITSDFSFENNLISEWDHIHNSIRILSMNIVHWHHCYVY